MRRYSSIDFLRGFMIFMMVVIHTPMRWYDRSWVEGSGDLEISGLTAVFFLILIFFSAWAGLFLMVSSVGNMISMQRNLDRGKSPVNIIMFQVVGGLLLLLFAVLVESTIGYHGYMGEVAEGSFDRWDMILWRGFHMETIHTIAICVIINGIVHGILSMKGGIRKPRRNMRIYAVLALLCILFTIPMWELAEGIYPGYPFDTWYSTLAGRDIMVQYPVIGDSGIPEIILKSILMPIAGAPEPIFPFLSISFIGSIIGIRMCQDKHDLRFPRKGIMIGAGIMILGLIGSVITIGSGTESIEILIDHSYELPGLYPNMWLWWFLAITGAELAVVILTIRLVEYRGIGKQFAKGTTFFRRYGFVAFTVYTFQFLDVVPRLVFQLFPDLSGMYPFPDKVSPLLVIILIPMVILTWEIILRSWEKIDYFGSLEWCMAKIVEKLMPGKRSNIGKTGRLPWWKVRRLDSREYLYKPTWLNLIGERSSDHDNLVDSKLSLWLSVFGFLFFPLSIISMAVSRYSIRFEGRNGYNGTALILGVLGTVAAVIELAVLSQVTIYF
ncbi:MAG: hypothetical protein ACMUIG_05075 [Thermoplasmatota archaeon]